MKGETRWTWQECFYKQYSYVLQISHILCMILVFHQTGNHFFLGFHSDYGSYFSTNTKMMLQFWDLAQKCDIPLMIWTGIPIFWSLHCLIRKHHSKYHCCINRYVHRFLIVNFSSTLFLVWNFCYCVCDYKSNGFHGVLKSQSWFHNPDSSCHL